MTAFSILQTMTISPFQNVILNVLDYALACGGWDDAQLYFDQLTPLAILSQQAEDTDKTIGQVADETNKEMENPAATDDSGDASVVDIDKPTKTPPNGTGPGEVTNIIKTSGAFFSNDYVMYDEDGNQIN